MHIASANPIAIDAAGVDPAVVKREKDILADKFRQQGKPEAMIEKITESGLKTFYKEQTLLEQPFIFDDKKSVGAGAEGSRRQGRRADQGHGLCALCARRGHREGDIRLCRRGRGGGRNAPDNRGRRDLGAGGTDEWPSPPTAA